MQRVVVEQVKEADSHQRDDDDPEDCHVGHPLLRTEVALQPTLRLCAPLMLRLSDDGSGGPVVTGWKMQTVAAPKVEPMLATAGIPASIDGWVGEPKLDGWRARILVDGDELAFRTRSGRVTSAPSRPSQASLGCATR
jgi:ATP-dependent DNA ligase